MPGRDRFSTTVSWPPDACRGRIGHSRFVTGSSPADPDRFQGKSLWNLDAGESGGGTLIDNGVHLLDLARWFMGAGFARGPGMSHAHPRPVRGGAGRRGAGQRPATAKTTPSGCCGPPMARRQPPRLLEVAGMPLSRDPWHARHLVTTTTRSRVRCQPTSLGATVSPLPPRSRSRPWPSRTRRGGATCRNLHERHPGRADPVPSGYDGLRAARMVDALYRSAASGKAE